MPDLTLDQVRKAGRFATYRGPNGVADYEPDSITVRALGDAVPLLLGYPYVGVELFADGWRHDDGCDCELCSPPDAQA